MRCDDSSKRYERFRLQWMMDHGYSLGDLMEQLDAQMEEAEPGFTIASLFTQWERESGFQGELWPCYAEYLMCDAEKISGCEEECCMDEEKR